MNLQQEKEFLSSYQAGLIQPEEVYQEYHKLVRFFVSKSGIPYESIEDCTQECLIAMLDIAKRYNPNLNFRFSTFLLSQLKGIRTQFLRNYKYWATRHKSLDCMMEDTGYDIPVEDAIELDFQDQFQFAVSSLTETEKKIIVLRFFQDKFYHDIAKELSLSETKVRGIEKKALRKMRLALAHAEFVHITMRDL